jgi:hypothetical protein
MHMPFATHMRTRSDASADTPAVRSQIRRAASMEGIALDPITQAPIIVPLHPPASSHSSTSEPTAVESVLSPTVSRNGSPSTEIAAAILNSQHNLNQNPPHPPAPFVPFPVPAPASLPTSPNPIILPQYTHLPDRSPLSTPSSSPTMLRTSATYAASIAHAAANPSKRGSATTSAQSTPLHSPVSSPGASPPTTGSQYLSGTGNLPSTTTPPQPNNVTTGTATGYSTGASSTSSSAAPSPMTSPRPARRPTLLNTPGQSGNITAPGAATGTGPGTAVPTQLNLDEDNLKSSKIAPVLDNAKILVPSFSQRIPSNIRFFFFFFFFPSPYFSFSFPQLILCLCSAVVITDINGDGKQELLVGTYDQTLFLFSFSSDEGCLYDAEVSNRIN